MEEKIPEPLDLRETDKPKNGIIRLPNYVVRQPKAPVFKESDLLTDAAKLERIYKLHPALRSLGNAYVANLMLEDRLRLERLAEMDDLMSVLRQNPGGTSKEVKAYSYELAMRSTDWISEGGSRHQENLRR